MPVAGLHKPSLRLPVGPVAIALASLSIASDASTSDFGVHEVAVRVGFRFDPDQVLLGSHLHLYEPGDKLRFGVAGALGFGDDVTAIDLTPEVHVIASENPVAPDTYFYAGGGIDWANFWTSVGETGTAHSSDSGLTLLGGIERHLDSGSTFFGEFRIRFGDTEWFAVVFGLGFPRR